jgi:hypothetical protein
VIACSAAAQPSNKPNGSLVPFVDSNASERNTANLISVYDKAIADLQKALVLQKSALESGSSADNAAVGLFAAKTLKALADATMGATGQIPGGGKVWKAAYDLVQSAIDIYEAPTPSGKTAAGAGSVAASIDLLNEKSKAANATEELKNFAEQLKTMGKLAGTASDTLQTINKATEQSARDNNDRNYVGTGGSLIKVIGGIVDLVTKEAPVDKISPAGTIKGMGEVVAAYGDFTEAKKELEKNRTIAESEQDTALQATKRIPEAIQLLMARKKILVAQQAAALDAGHDPSSLTPQDQRARLRNEKIIASETLGGTDASGSSKVSVGQQSETSAAGNDLSSLMQQEQQAKLRNEKIIASETLGKSSPSDNALKDASNGADLDKALNQILTSEMGESNPYLKDLLIPELTRAGQNPISDPFSLTPQEQQARLRNEKIIASETLGQSSSSNNSLDSNSNGGDLDKALNQNMTDEMGPSNAYLRDLLISEWLGGERSTATNVTFDPSLMSPHEREAWQINQTVVKDETLGKSAKGATPLSKLESGQLRIDGQYYSPDSGHTWLRLQDGLTDQLDSSPLQRADQIDPSSAGQLAQLDESSSFSESLRSALDPVLLGTNGMSQFTEPSSPGQRAKASRSAGGNDGSGSSEGRWSRFFSGLDAALKIAQAGVDAYENAKRSSTPTIVSRPTVQIKASGGTSAGATRQAGSQQASPTSVRPTGGMCPAGYSVNPQVAACLNAPLFINGVPNYCDHNADGSFINLCIPTRK